MSSWSFPYTPTPPSHHLSWDRLNQDFPWLEPLKNTPQDPGWHAEGNVWIHTRMVLEELVAMPEWQALEEPDRSLLFLAALFHDIAKPECTETASDGRIIAPGHAKKGRRKARYLMREAIAPSVPFPLREQIVHLVRYHGLPLWALGKKDDRRSLIEASQFVRMDQLALLAEADARGRTCQDQEELLLRADLFREACEELGCYRAPFPFPDSLSRFRYFNKPDANPYYQAFDNTWGEVILMSGLPGAGKDTWIRKNAPQMTEISLDKIRAELKVSPKGNQGKVIQLAKERAKQLLRQKQAFVWNSTNITRNLRQQLVDLFVTYKARVKIVYIEPKPEVLYNRNRNRQYPVPKNVLTKLLRKLEVPLLTEAHEVIYIHA